jgi:hypothetical protein
MGESHDVTNAFNYSATEKPHNQALITDLGAITTALY